MRISEGGGERLLFIHSDHLGSTILITDERGERAAEQRFYPYGEVRWREGAFPTDYGFTGQRWEQELGLYDYKARFYDPALGRFISADTVVPNPGNPQALNRYSYAYNRPLVYVDHSGHIPIPPVVIAVGLLVLKLVDWGWTAWDSYQSLRVMNDPNASEAAKAEAAANLALAAAFEAAEPDDLLLVGLPLDDLARKGLVRLGREAGEEALEEGLERAGREAIEELPEQIHHFATNKSSRWTDRMAEIAQKYGLDLDDAWNKGLIPQRGRHPDAYHEWVLDQMREIDEIAQGNREVFLELFERKVTQKVREHPEMLRRWYWEGRGP
jgi:RHS repeat-associated protein